LIIIAFNRTIDEVIQNTMGGFRTAMITTSDASSLVIDIVMTQIMTAIEIFNQNGSNWLFDHVIQASVRTGAYRPLQGSIYTKSPNELINKRAVLNIKNDDEYCFLYCIAAHIHYVKKHPDYSNQYLQYFKELNYRGLTFPLKVCDVAKFEAMNPDIAVNVLIFENKEVIPLHPILHRHRKHQINLLLIETKGKYHFMLVRNLSRPVAVRTKVNKATYVCPSCLHPLSSENCLIRHRDECSLFSAQKCIYPTPGKNTSKFTNIFKQMKAPFAIYFDFESFLVPQNDESNVKATHEPCGFCIRRTSEFKQYEKPVFLILDLMSSITSLSIFAMKNGKYLRY